jgi:hypothetical protein
MRPSTDGPDAPLKISVDELVAKLSDEERLRVAKALVAGAFARKRTAANISIPRLSNSQPS